MLTKVWNNSNIRIRQEDRYVCLTDMAKATGKNVNDFFRLDKTKSYLDVLSSIVGIPVMADGTKVEAVLVEISKGGNVSNSGTWAYPKVALRFAQWCSDDFAVQVDCWIDELVTTGSVSIKANTYEKPKPLTPQEKLALIQTGLSLLDRIGLPINERDRIMHQNMVNNALRSIDNEASIVHTEPQEERKLTLTEIAQAVFGVNVRRGSRKGEDANLGTHLVKRWRLKYGLTKDDHPEKTNKYFNRRTTASAATGQEIQGMNCYPQEDWHLVGELLIENGYAIERGREYLMSLAEN